MKNMLSLTRIATLESIVMQEIVAFPRHPAPSSFLLAKGVILIYRSSRLHRPGLQHKEMEIIINP